MNRLDRYLRSGRLKVPGWLGPNSAEMIRALSDIQHALRFRGAVGEIGVHLGRLFILLVLTADDGERSFAIDIFEEQHLSVDPHYQGSTRQRFVENVWKWAGDDRRVSIFARSSLEVSPDDIVRECGEVRLASIDGGHSRECALNDLRLMESVLTPQGIVILDDYFNNDWPGVSTGTAEYLLDPRSKLRPFSISANKVYLTARENHGVYRAELRKRFAAAFGKTSQMFGDDVDIYRFGSANPGLIEQLKGAVKETAIGQRLLSAKRAVWGKRGG